MYCNSFLPAVGKISVQHKSSHEPGCYWLAGKYALNVYEFFDPKDYFSHGQLNLAVSRYNPPYSQIKSRYKALQCRNSLGNQQVCHCKKKKKSEVRGRNFLKILWGYDFCNFNRRTLVGFDQ